MFCGACGTENLDHLQFCVRCGAALAHQRTPAPGRSTGAGGALQAPRLHASGGGDVGSDLGASLGGFATGGGFRGPSAQGVMTPPPVRGTPAPGSGGDVGPDLGASLGGRATGGDFRPGSGGDIGSDLSRSLGSSRTGVPGSGGGSGSGSGGGGGQPASDTYAVGMAQGSIVADRYEVKSLLGRGGMGAVYRVLDRLRGKEVALKVMLPSLMAREKAVERFLHEAELALALADPRIVRVFDVGEDRALGLRFYTMELIQGMSLREWLEEKKKLNAPLTPDEIIGLMEDLLSALAIAHKSTIHRDLKPENLMIVAAEKGVSLKILDFGIAKLKGAKQFTSTSMALGTAYYMAPEQQTDAANVDARADLYSVGVIFYELLTGRLPVGRFKTPSEERPALSRALDALILRALESEPGKRPPSAEAFLAELRAVKAGGGAAARPGGGGKGALAAALVLAVLLGGGGLVAWKGGLLSEKGASSPGASASSSSGASGAAVASSSGGSPGAAGGSSGAGPSGGGAGRSAGAGGGSSGSSGALAAGSTAGSSAGGASSRPETVPAPLAKPRLVSLDRPVAGALLRGDVLVEGRVEGPVARVVVNGLPTTPDEGGRFSIKVAGKATIRVVGLNARGEQAFEQAVGVNLDDDPPVITLRTPGRVVTAVDRIDVEGSVSDANPGTSAEVNGAAFELVKGSFKAPGRRLERGENRFRIVVRDGAGNVSEATLVAILDRDPPVVSLSSPPDGVVTREGAVLVRGDAHDDVGVAKVLLNGKEVPLERGRTFQTSFALTQDGPATIEARAVDQAGNVSAPYSVEVRRDQRAPELVLDPLPDRISTPRVTLGGTLDEDECTVTVDGLSAVVAGRRFEQRVEADRPKEIEIVARDRAGNETRRTVPLVPAPPPVAAGPSGGAGGASSGAGAGGTTGASAGGGAGSSVAGRNPEGARLAPGSIEGEGGIIGTVNKLDRDFGKVVVTLAPGAKVMTSDLLDIVRGEGGSTTKVGRVRVTRADPRRTTISVEPERGGPVDAFRPGDRLVIPKG